MNLNEMENDDYTLELLDENDEDAINNMLNDSLSIETNQLPEINEVLQKASAKTLIPQETPVRLNCESSNERPKVLKRLSEDNANNNERNEDFNKFGSKRPNIAGECNFNNNSNNANQSRGNYNNRPSAYRGFDEQVSRNQNQQSKQTNFNNIPVWEYQQQQQQQQQTANNQQQQNEQQSFQQMHTQRQLQQPQLYRQPQQQPLQQPFYPLQMPQPPLQMPLPPLQQQQLLQLQQQLFQPNLLNVLGSNLNNTAALNQLPLALSSSSNQLNSSNLIGQNILETSFLNGPKFFQLANGSVLELNSIPTNLNISTNPLNTAQMMPNTAAHTILLDNINTDIGQIVNLNAGTGLAIANANGTSDPNSKFGNCSPCFTGKLCEEVKLSPIITSTSNSLLGKSQTSTVTTSSSIAASSAYSLVNTKPSTSTKSSTKYQNVAAVLGSNVNSGVSTKTSGDFKANFESFPTDNRWEETTTKSAKSLGPTVATVLRLTEEEIFGPPTRRVLNMIRNLALDFMAQEKMSEDNN